MTAVKMSEMCQENTLCGSVDLGDNSKLQEIKFKIRTFFGKRNDVFIDSPQIKIAVVCNTTYNDLITSSVVTNQTFFLEDTQADHLNFVPFTCKYPACCTSFTYTITDQDQNATSAVNMTNFGNIE